MWIYRICQFKNQQQQVYNNSINNNNNKTKKTYAWYNQSTYCSSVKLYLNKIKDSMYQFYTIMIINYTE